MQDTPYIRPLTLDDLDSIIALKGSVIKRPEFDPAIERGIYEWELERNPCRRDDFPIGFVLQHKTKVVGSVVLVPAECSINGNSVYSCFEVDLMVDSDFRFHGLKLLNKVWSSDTFSLVVATTPNKLSFDIEKHLGAKEVAFTAHEYVRFIDPLSIGAKKYHSRVIGVMLLALKVLFLIIGKLFKIGRSQLLKKKYFVSRVDKFDSRFDSFCEDASQSYSLVIARNSKYLNWRYIDFPFGQRAIYVVSDDRQAIHGYMIIQHEMMANGIRVAHILEIFTRRDDAVALQILLDEASRHAVRNKLEWLKYIPSGKHIESALVAAGFIRHNLPIPSCIYRMNLFGAAAGVPDNQNDWFMSSGDGDTAIYSAVSWNEGGVGV